MSDERQTSSGYRGSNRYRQTWFTAPWAVGRTPQRGTDFLTEATDGTVNRGDPETSRGSL